MLPLSMPLIQLRPELAAGDIVMRAREFDWLVVTSPSAVRCLLVTLRECAVDVRSLPRILACGPGTLRELKAAGLVPAALPEKDFGAKGLLAVARTCIGKGDRVLRVRSDKAGPVLADSLREQGAVVEDVCLYRNDPLPQDSLLPFDTVFFASSSAVTAFVVAWGVEALADKTVLAIGKPTAKALKALGISDVIVGPEATVKSAIGCLAAECVDRAILTI